MHHNNHLPKRNGYPWCNFGKLDKYFQQPTFFLCLKEKILIQCIVLAMIYASENWSLPKKMENKIRATKMTIERKMLGVRWEEKRTNASI